MTDDKEMQENVIKMRYIEQQAELIKQREDY